jgi:hypothetical protein
MEAGEPEPSSGDENAVLLSLSHSHNETLDVLRAFRGANQHVGEWRCARVAAIKGTASQPKGIATFIVGLVL